MKIEQLQQDLLNLKIELRQAEKQIGEYQNRKDIPLALIIQKKRLNAWLLKARAKIVQIQKAGDAT